jgi:hypothetical protein
MASFRDATALPDMTIEPSAKAISTSEGFFGEQYQFPRFLFRNMGSRARKRSLSAHQKQIWFLTGLCIVAVSLFTALIFWLANAPAFPGR